MTIKSTTTDPLNAKINGYYIFGKNNSQLVRDQLEILGFTRYDSLPMGGVKFNWITRLTDIDWKTFDSNFQILNHISNEKQLSNKGLLLTNLRNYEINSSVNNYLPLKTFLPETYLLDNTTDRMNFKKTFRKDSTWICKPVGLSCGREVFIFRNEEQLENLLNQYHKTSRMNSYSTLYYNRLVQKYIEKPLLINKHKFDIRTYLLCICTSNEIVCFAAQTGYLRFSIYEYDLENINQFIHLTNQSIQRKNKDFLSLKDKTGMTMEEFNEYFNESIQPNMSHIDKDWVLNQLPEKITKILLQVADSVREKLSIREGCFGFYGADILIDEKLNCWLLEMNSGPTLDMTNKALEKVIPICLNEAINIVIESLENYRSTGSVFPPYKSNLFKYLPPSKHSMFIPSLLNVNLSFTSSYHHQIDLTPGGRISFRHNRHFPLSSKSNKQFSKPFAPKLKAKPMKTERRAIVQTVKVKLNREHLSHQLTELIRTHNKPINT